MQAVQQDRSLDLEIRNQAVNIYYRGGSLYRIEPRRRGYKVTFDEKYFLQEHAPLTGLGYAEWLARMPELKLAMEGWQAAKNRNLERILQQEITRVNNDQLHSEYRIVDIEYVEYVKAADSEKNRRIRFDMMAVKLSGEGAPCLSIMELKVGKGSIGGSAGIGKHLEDEQLFLQHTKDREELLKEMEKLYAQKRKLGLIAGPGETVCLDRNRIEFVFLLADGNAKSKVLPREREKILASEAYRALCGACDVRECALDTEEVVLRAGSMMKLRVQA